MNKETERIELLEKSLKLQIDLGDKFQAENTRLDNEKWKRDYLTLKMDYDYLVTICDNVVKMNDIHMAIGMVKGALMHVRSEK